MDKKDVWPSHLKCLHADVPIRFSSNGTSSSYKDKVEDEFKLHSCTLSGKEKKKNLHTDALTILQNGST